MLPTLDSCFGEMAKPYKLLLTSYIKVAWKYIQATTQDAEETADNLKASE